jgi:hypothetical protein
MIFLFNLDFVTTPLHTHIINAHNIIKKQLESEPVHNLNVPIILTEPLSALFYSYHVLYHLCAHALLVLGQILTIQHGCVTSLEYNVT